MTDKIDQANAEANLVFSDVLQKADGTLERLASTFRARSTVLVKDVPRAVALSVAAGLLEMARLQLRVFQPQSSSSRPPNDEHG